jgi:hypothetical protein
MIPLSEQNKFVGRNLSELGKWLGFNGLDRFAVELADNDRLKSALEKAVKDVEFFRTKTWDGVLRLGLYRAAQYALIRHMRAQTVVETGVLHGLTSAFMLEALRVNKSGVLISIDLPSTFEGGPSNADGFDDTLPPRLPPGWVVDEALRPSWSLRLGSSADLLPEICREAGSVDIFLHDSEHTYATMQMEFETAWPAIREGGLLIADNIDCNTAFFDFCRKVKRVPYVAPVDPDHVRPAVTGIRFGLIQK